MFNFVEGCAPPLCAEEFENLGVKLLSFPISATLAYAQMMTAFAAHLKKHGTTAGAQHAMLTLREYEALLDRSSYL